MTKVSDYRLISFILLKLMVSRCNWFLGMLFLIAAFTCLIHPSSYIAIAFQGGTRSVIAVLFLLMGLIILPTANQLCSKSWNLKLNGDTKKMLILISLLFMLLILPQVETNISRLFTSPIAYLEARLK